VIDDDRSRPMPATTPNVFSTSVLADDVDATARFYVEHFGFERRLDIGWFTTLHHGDRPYELNVVERSHASVPERFRQAPAGVILAFLVDDVDEVAARLTDAGVDLVSPVIDEEYGQRHVFVTDPSGPLVDVVKLPTPSPEWLAATGLTSPAQPT
jgi:catechol 2,3-dioxygenase-like lactoylglutathione lyase family enzyme